ncbi:hypothetical protein E2C01_007152 [Portunus trituberculatus]|uniref:Uncharacterized protein n=1 Tax=Portunus trituberculatus TaxID=210409 RepID=A0A5B7CX29_PORTR|nr:hypothetical protein [Portunus trituberculatus]
MEFLSGSEYTATVFTPRRRAVRITRQAISPRLAMSSLLMGRQAAEECWRRHQPPTPPLRNLHPLGNKIRQRRTR